MTITGQQPPEISSAWNWPAEWAIERTFWSEVATRTVAGVLTIVLMAVPGLVYATIFGLLRLAAVLPILIGIALFAVVLVMYIVVLRVIRRRERKKIAGALAKDESRSGSIPSPEEIMSSSMEERKRIMSVYSQAIQDGVSQADRLGRRAARWSTVVALVCAIAGFVVPLLFFTTAK